jgi:hypothetical protein
MVGAALVISGGLVLGASFLKPFEIGVKAGPSRETVAVTRVPQVSQAGDPCSNANVQLPRLSPPKSKRPLFVFPDGNLENLRAVYRDGGPESTTDLNIRLIEHASKPALVENPFDTEPRKGVSGGSDDSDDSDDSGNSGASNVGDCSRYGNDIVIYRRPGNNAVAPSIHVGGRVGAPGTAGVDGSGLDAPNGADQ